MHERTHALSLLTMECVCVCVYVFAVSWQVGGIGVNLVGADRVLLYDPGRGCFPLPHAAPYMPDHTFLMRRSLACV